MPRHWLDHSEELLLETRIFDVRAHKRASPRDGSLHDFFVLDAPDWVNVVAVTDSGDIILIEQFRHGTADVTLEIPGGMIDAGEDARTAALRELLEETGYAPERIEPIGTVQPNPAIQANRCTTFFAWNCRKVSETRFDTTEECALRLEPANRAEELVRNGEIGHALVVAGLGYAWLHGLLPRDSTG